MIGVKLLCLMGGVLGQFGASQDEMDLFDLVEEVNHNFYEFVGVAPDATTREIKKQYRTLSLTWHPDKNDTESAADNFRMLAQIVEVLKNSELRERYDRVLVEGLPNWRSAAYYMRKMRKMSSTEIIILLTITATTIHYCTMWGSYWEKKMILADQIDAVSKRKKQQAAVEHLKLAKDQVKKPEFKNLLPFLLVKSMFYFLCAIPVAIKTYREAKRIELEQIRLEKEEAEEEEREIKQEKERREKHKKEKIEKEKQRKKVDMEKRAKQLKEIQELHAKKQQEEDEYAQLEADLDDNQFSKSKQKAEDRPWTDEDYITLTKMLNKFPGGTSNRWDRIANDMDRPVAEVIKRTKEAQKKMHAFSAGAQNRYSSATILKTKRTVDVNAVGGTSVATEQVETEPPKPASDEWSQTQQKLLELGMKKFGKDVEGRWDKIADDVVGKDKKQCIARYKFLVEEIRKQKS